MVFSSAILKNTNKNVIIELNIPKAEDIYQIYYLTAEHLIYAGDPRFLTLSRWQENYPMSQIFAYISQTIQKINKIQHKHQTTEENDYLSYKGHFLIPIIEKKSS